MVAANVGQSHGTRTVVEDCGKVSGRQFLVAECVCGRRDRVTVYDFLRSEECRSCAAAKRNTTHGDNKRVGRAPEYRIWSGMVTRCTNPASTAWPRYGGRGIRVCDRWRVYENFLADMGRRPSGSHQIDRIDNDGPYSPENCRWATRVEQGCNRRSNVLVEAFGTKLTLSGWARATGIRAGTIRRRIVSGWHPDKALSAPMTPGLPRDGMDTPGRWTPGRD